MSRRFFDRRCPHALTVWLCALVHLAAFVGSAWHSHRGHEHSGGSAVPAMAVKSHADDGHEHDRDSGTAPLDERDSDGCGICKVISALRHGTPGLADVLVLPMRQVSAESGEIQLNRSVASLWRDRARGPPGSSSALASSLA